MLHLTPSRNLHLASAILLSNSILISTGRVCYSLLCVFHITYVLVAHFSLFVIIFWVLYSLENEFLGGRNCVLLVSRMSLPQHLTDTRRCISRCLKPHIIGPSLSFQPQIPLNSPIHHSFTPLTYFIHNTQLTDLPACHVQPHLLLSLLLFPLPERFPNHFKQHYLHLHLRSLLNTLPPHSLLFAFLSPPVDSFLSTCILLSLHCSPFFTGLYTLGRQESGCTPFSAQRHSDGCMVPCFCPH